MQKDTIIYVTDQRQKYLADMLGGEQTDCRNIGGIEAIAAYAGKRASSDI